MPRGVPDSTLESDITQQLQDVASIDTRRPIRPQLTPSGSDSSRRSSRGSTATTIQISLHPKASNAEPPKSSWETSIQSFEFAGSGENLNAVTLPPADEGFGAWSYVASAFSMFIVVWGKHSVPVYLHEDSS